MGQGIDALASCQGVVRAHQGREVAAVLEAGQVQYGVIADVQCLQSRHQLQPYKV